MSERTAHAQTPPDIAQRQSIPLAPTQRGRRFLETRKHKKSSLDIWEHNLKETYTPRRLDEGQSNGNEDSSNSFDDGRGLCCGTPMYSVSGRTILLELYNPSISNSFSLRIYSTPERYALFVLHDICSKERPWSWVQLTVHLFEFLVGWYLDNCFAP